MDCYWHAETIVFVYVANQNVTVTTLLMSLVHYVSINSTDKSYDRILLEDRTASCHRCHHPPPAGVPSQLPTQSPLQLPSEHVAPEPLAVPSQPPTQSPEQLPSLQYP